MRTLFRCPYGHDAEFDTERFRMGATQYTNITCKECLRKFCVEQLRVELRSRQPDWTDRIMGVDYMTKCYEVKTAVSEAHNERVAYTLLDTQGWSIKMWTGKALTFVGVED